MAELVRTQTSFIVNAWLQKKVDFQKYWPIEEVDEVEKSPLTKRRLSNMFKKLKAQEMERRKLAESN